MESFACCPEMILLYMLCMPKTKQEKYKRTLRALTTFDNVPDKD